MVNAQNPNLEILKLAVRQLGEVSDEMELIANGELFETNTI